MDSDSSIAARFLDEFAASVNAKDFAAHMALISEQASIKGLPGFDAIGYEEWARQCKHEFDEGILDHVDYNGLVLREHDAGRIVFATVETVRASDASVNTMGLEMEITREEDGNWRMTRQRLLDEEEMGSLQFDAE
ncbi:MAG: nuclear transport factor 2 family protein [Gammaproteobacteria bacterium]|nr:nuclear transport factor 2 family protein [Gammaproteobacteria bacterium]